MYSEIKSEFVKKELKKTAWKEREYIKDLMKIEELATGVLKGVMVFHWTRHYPPRYPAQWKAIWKELNPEGYKRWLDRSRKEKERDRRETTKIEREEKEELRREKREWKGIKMS